LIHILSPVYQSIKPSRASSHQGRGEHPADQQASQQKGAFSFAFSHTESNQKGGVPDHIPANHSFLTADTSMRKNPDLRRTKNITIHVSYPE
jgi:hypothetical protein